MHNCTGDDHKAITHAMFNDSRGIQQLESLVSCQKM